MKDQNQNSNIISQVIRVPVNEPFFDESAAQIAQPVVPLNEVPTANFVPTVTMRTAGKSFNPLMILSALLVVALGVAAAFLISTEENSPASSAPAETVLEENKVPAIEPARPVQNSKTETLAAAPPLKVKNFGKHSSRAAQNGAIEASDETERIRTEPENKAGDDDEPPPIRRISSEIIKDKRIKKHLPKIERVEKEFKHVKEILDAIDNN